MSDLLHLHRMQASSQNAWPQTSVLLERVRGLQLADVVSCPATP